MTSDDELQRWAGQSEIEALRTLRAEDPVLQKRELRRWQHRGDRRHLIRELYVDEQIEAGVVAALRKLKVGLLVLTDRRLLFVSERVSGRPRVISIERPAVVSMSVEEEYRYGTIQVETAGAKLAFRSVRNEEAWKFVGHWLAGVNNSDRPQPEPVAVAVRDRPSAVERFETSVTVTSEARALIAAAGGTLYLWQEPFNESFATDKLAMRQPEGVEFRTLSHGSVVVQAEADLPQPREVEVGVSRWPRRRVKVTWDGEQWGRRGFDLGGGA